MSCDKRVLLPISDCRRLSDAFGCLGGCFEELIEPVQDLVPELHETGHHHLTGNSLHLAIACP